MSRTDALRCMCKVLSVLCFGWILARAPSAMAMSAIDGLDEDQVSVRELMRLETAQALQRARAMRQGYGAAAKMVDRGAGGTDGSSGGGWPANANASQSEPELMAIYGVGRNLMAEVVFGETRRLYRRGQALPVGVSSSPHVFLLQDISTACIRLRRPDAERHLCMDATPRAGR